MVWLNRIGLYGGFVLCMLVLLPYAEKLYGSRKGVKPEAGLEAQLFRNHYNTIFVILMLAGFWVRLHKFGLVPAGFNQDGAMGAVDALALAQYGTDRFGMRYPVHFTAWGFGQMSVLLSYFSIPILSVYGLNSFTARLPMLLLSLMSLPVLYSLGKMLFDQRAALIIAGIGALSPWHIMQSRWALDCNTLPHMFLFSFWFLCRALQGKKGYLYLSMVSFGLTMYAYGIAWYTVPLFLMCAAFYLYKTRRFTLPEIGLAALAHGAVAWPIFAVALINTLGLPTVETPFFTIPYFPGTSRRGDILFFSGNVIRQFWANIKAFLEVVVLQRPDLPWNTIPGFGSLYVFSMPFTITGLVLAVREHRFKDSRGIEADHLGSRAAVVLLLIWLAVSILSGIVINGVNVNRINIIFYPLILLCGFGISFTIQRIKAAAAGVALLYLLAFVQFVSVYFGSHAQVLGRAFFEGFGESMAYVRNMDYDVIYITNRTQSENSWWVSEPLALFHHEVDALYFQGRANQYTRTGKRLLPYRERYRYIQIQHHQIDHRANAVYIVHNSELGYFDEASFDFAVFAHFSAVIPKRE